MKLEPVIYCKYKEREKSIVIAAVVQPNNTVALFFKNSLTVVGKKDFGHNYTIVDAPVDGLGYQPQGLPKMKVATKKVEAAVATIAPKVEPKK